MSDTLCPADLIWLQISRDHVAWIVVPHPAHDFTATYAGRLVHSLLLRTAEGALLALQRTGEPWTAQRISELLASLAAVEELTFERPGDGSVPQRTGPPAACPRVAIDRTDDAFWRTRQVAATYCADRALRGTTAPEADACARAAEEFDRALQGAVDAAMARFAAAALDAELLELSRREGRLELQIYNYLVRPSHRRNRVQFVRAFPVFAGVVASAPKGGHAAAVGAWVDKGKPLLANLAGRLGVSAAPIRALRQVPLEAIGPALQTYPWDLVRVLNALCAEDLPRTPAQWRALTEACALGVRRFGPRPWGSPLAAAWLRGAARDSWRKLRDPPDASREIGRQQVSAINQLRGRARDALVIECELAGSAGEPALVDSLARSIVARTLARMTLAQLRQRAQRYRDLATHSLAQRALAAQPDDLFQYLPLLPMPYRTLDGSRLVECLTSRPAIRGTGRILQNCLANWRASGYLDRCATGQGFLIRQRALAGGPVLSVAYLQLEFERGGRAPVLQVIEHKGPGNTPPSAQCAQAVAEVTRCLTAGNWRNHLLRIIAAVRHADRIWRGQDDLAQIDQCRQLVRDTFGTKLYCRMVAELLRSVERSLLPLFADPARSSMRRMPPVDELSAADDVAGEPAMTEADDIPF